METDPEEMKEEEPEIKEATEAENTETGNFVFFSKGCTNVTNISRL